MRIVEEERATYDAIWGLPEYAEASPGELYLPAFLDMAGDERGSVLDAGCGSGKGALALESEGFKVQMCDLSSAGLERTSAERFLFFEQCLWRPIAHGHYDWVYCCDVLEHIPPTFAMLVAARLLEASVKGVFFSISLVPDHYGAWVGKPLHQTVQSFVDWRDQLAEVGTVLEARDLHHVGLYLVRPRD